MNDWRRVCIGDIANIPKKQAIANPHEIELLTVRLYAKGVERTGKYPRATERGRPYFAREAGEILIGRQNFHNGGIGVVRKGDHGLICSNAITSIIPNDNADKDFLFYLLSSFEFRKSIHKQSEGTGQSEISETKILSLELDLPPLPEQKKISEILSSIDKDIQCHLKRLQALGDFQSSLYGEIPSRAEAEGGVMLGDIISSINSGWSPVCLPKSRVGKDPAILKTTAITRQGYVPEENKSLPTDHDLKDSAIVRPGDILCTRKGPRERVGVVCYVSETPPSLMVPDTAFRIRVTETMNSNYIALVLGSKEVQGDWNRKKVGLAEAQVNINHGILKDTYIPLPSSERQAALVNAITSSQERIDMERAKIIALQTLRSAVSSDLLSGRKRVSV